MIGKRQSSSARRLGVLLASAVILSACGSDMDDLRAYIDEVKARPGGRIEPLPEIRPTPTFVYAADRAGARSAPGICSSYPPAWSTASRISRKTWPCG